MVQEWTAHATHERPVLGRSGSVLPATGRRLRWDGVDIMPMRGALVVRKDTYLDQAALLRKLQTSSS